MSKTWETLFNLCTFMKYLLSEVLPGEKVDSPSYVLVSLNDLLVVTANCIEKIKYETKVNKVHGNNKTNLSEELNDRNEEGELFHDIQENADCDLDQNKSSRITTFSSTCNDNEFKKTENSHFKELPEKFVKLCNEMIKGSTAGHYCRPCDIVILSQELWEKHLTYRIHYSLNEDCESVLCKHCNLVIFSNNIDSENLMFYHQQKHFELGVELEHCSKGNDESVKPAEVKRGIFDKTILQTSHKDLNELKTALPLKVDTSISSVFVELDKHMHLGLEKGFYCNLCNEAFHFSDEWSKHFRIKNVHLNQMDVSGCFKKCAHCQLVIFANSSVQLIYNKYHLIGHEESVKQEEAMNCNLEDVNTNSKDLNNFGSLKSEIISSPGKDKASKNIFIVKQFKDLNSKIHSSNIHGCYFCRLCNACFYDNQEWINHSLEEKHLQLLMKLKSWEGKCGYCSLTIIGTREIVTCYMEFHTIGHEQPLSFEEKIIHQASLNQSHLKSNTVKLDSSQLGATKKSFKANCNENNREGIETTLSFGQNSNKQILHSAVLLCEEQRDKKGSDLLEASTQPLKKKKKKKVKSISPSRPLVNEGINNDRTDIHKTEDNVSGNFNSQVINTAGNTNEDSDYNRLNRRGAKGDQDSLFFQLLNSRIEQKQKTGHSNFGGLCLFSQSLFEDAFMWEDHLSDENHCSNHISTNVQGGIKQLDIHICGSMEHLMKFKSLVKGYSFFIDNFE